MKNYGATSTEAQDTKKSIPKMYMGIKNTAYVAESSCDESSPFSNSNNECDSEYDEEISNDANGLMYWSRNAAKEIAAKITKSAKGLDLGSPFKSSRVDSQDKFIVVDTTSATNFLKESISVPERVQLPIRNGRSYFDTTQLPCKISDDQLSVENTYYKLSPSKQITKRDLDRLENKIHSLDKQSDIEGTSSVSDESVVLIQGKTSPENIHINNEQTRDTRSNEIVRRDTERSQFQPGKVENNRRAADSQTEEDKNIIPTNLTSKGRERDKILKKRQEYIEKRTKVDPSLGMLNTNSKFGTSFDGYTQKARTLLEDLDSCEKGESMKISEDNNSENKEILIEYDKKDSTGNVHRTLQKIPRLDAAFRFSLKQYSDKDMYVTAPEAVTKEIRSKNTDIEDQNSFKVNNSYEARSERKPEQLLSRQPRKTDSSNETTSTSEFSSDSSKSGNMLTNLEFLRRNGLSADIRKYLANYSDYNPKLFLPTKYQERSNVPGGQLLQDDQKFKQDWEEIMAPYVAAQLILDSNINIATDCHEESSSESGNRETTNPTSYAETADPSSSSLNSMSEQNIPEKGDIVWTATKSVAQISKSQFDIDVEFETSGISNNLAELKSKMMPKHIATDPNSMRCAVNRLVDNNANSDVALAYKEKEIESSSTQQGESNAKIPIQTNDAIISPSLNSKKEVKDSSAVLVSPRVALLKEVPAAVNECPSSPSLWIVTPMETSLNSSSSTVSINCSSFEDANDPSKEFVLGRDIAIKETISKLERDKQKGKHNTIYLKI